MDKIEETPQDLVASLAEAFAQAHAATLEADARTWEAGDAWLAALNQVTTTKAMEARASARAERAQEAYFRAFSSVETTTQARVARKARARRAEREFRAAFWESIKARDAAFQAALDLKEARDHQAAREDAKEEARKALEEGAKDGQD